MLGIQQGRSASNCQGMSRRAALKAGFLGLSGLGLADLLRLRAHGQARTKDTAVILLWLDGGPSQLESYDPKPDASTEYRGPFGVLRTNVTGMMISETLPRHTRHADKMAFVRSLHHDTGDHFAGAHWMLTGRGGATGASPQPRFPGVGAYVSRMRGANAPGMPPYVGLPAAESVYLFPGYHGASYLGQAYNPFAVENTMHSLYIGASDPRKIGRPKAVNNFTAQDGGCSERRVHLLSSFDTVRRDLDQSGAMDTMDRFQQQAVSMILSGKARAAFDIDKEDPKYADRYGPGPWGRYTLMARRLVEAGVTFVTVDMPHWDDHSNIKVGHGTKLAHLDMAVDGLLRDLTERDMLDRVLVVAMGEFGRTPRINTGQPGIPIPGRDHWGNAISVMMAGGGLRGGQVVGRTNARAEHPVDRPLKPGDILATVYHVLGIDPETMFKDHTGRPVPMLDEGKPIAELL
jgi:uncharacterized protein (DUF1501 family)